MPYGIQSLKLKELSTWKLFFISNPLDSPVNEMFSLKLDTCQAWWNTPIIPGTQEPEAGGSPF